MERHLAARQRVSFWFIVGVYPLNYYDLSL